MQKKVKSNKEEVGAISNDKYFNSISSFDNNDSIFLNNHSTQATHSYSIDAEVEKGQLCFDFYHLSSSEVLDLVDYSISKNSSNHFTNYTKIHTNIKSDIDLSNNFNVAKEAKIQVLNNNENLSLEEKFLVNAIWTEILETQWRLDKQNIVLDKHCNLYEQITQFMKQKKLRKDDTWFLPIIYAMHDEILHQNKFKSELNNKEDEENSFFSDVKSYVKRKKLHLIFSVWYAENNNAHFLAFKKINEMILPTSIILDSYNHSFENQTNAYLNSPKKQGVECIVGLNSKKHNEVKRNCFSLNTFVPAGSFYDNKYIHLNTYYFQKEIIQGKSYAKYNFMRIFLHELGHAVYNDILHDRNNALKNKYAKTFLKNHTQALKKSYVNYIKYDFSSSYDKSAMAYYVKHKTGKRINTKTKKYQFLLDRGFEESFAESFSILSYIMLCEEYENIKKTIKVLYPLLNLLNNTIDWEVFGFTKQEVLRKQKIVKKFLNNIKI